MRPSVSRFTPFLFAVALSTCPERVHSLVTLACPYCGASEAPASTTWSSRIAPADESGTPLEITGTVYRADGRTPLAGALIYAHHADARGVVRPVDAAHGHGPLRGWARTDSTGRFRFLTIRPGGADARVDMTITTPGTREMPLAPVLLDHVATDPRGVQHVVRNITLERVQ